MRIQYALRFTCLADWGPKVDVVVFCFLDLASNYEPPDSLAEWLEVGEQPVYSGFDSLPLEEPEKMTNIILQALEITRQRVVINRGWGGLGNLAEPSDSVYLVDNCPHDWLFQRCSAVVHHGVAGTTAAGLKAAVTDNAIFLGSLTSVNDPVTHFWLIFSVLFSVQPQLYHSLGTSHFGGRGCMP
ncbi:PREDICTED: sterol 3-beta-glucosyltransferase UGT80A2-like [Prunus mume]|uniref:Sterol 3-beta-glucosyltransferase UGT80A2-like n=1 Tax=Prunus mume TaxID=102107 RepID=A0ABM0P8C4_PRUMU|nr:PREDICTED: sterol 3-beta-glucosyltransferase UGT80A2-like [Prunus mume]